MDFAKAFGACEGHRIELMDEVKKLTAELATLRQWDARKPEVQAKVLEVAADTCFVDLALPMPIHHLNEHGQARLTGLDVSYVIEMEHGLRTGKRPALKLEGDS